MSKVDRNNPKRSSASESRYSLFEFEHKFPDDAACLELLVQRRYPDSIYCPKCERVTKHHRETNRPSYACQFCGHHEHPLVGTIFEKSATSTVTENFELVDFAAGGRPFRGSEGLREWFQTFLTALPDARNS